MKKEREIEKAFEEILVTMLKDCLKELEEGDNVKNKNENVEYKKIADEIGKACDRCGDKFEDIIDNRKLATKENLTKILNSLKNQEQLFDSILKNK